MVAGRTTTVGSQTTSAGLGFHTNHALQQGDVSWTYTSDGMTSAMPASEGVWLHAVMCGGAWGQRGSCLSATGARSAARLPWSVPPLQASSIPFLPPALRYCSLSCLGSVRPIHFQYLYKHADTPHSGLICRLPCIYHDERNCRCHPQTTSEAAAPFALYPAGKSLRSALEVSSRRCWPGSTPNAVDSEGHIRLLLGCDADETEARGHAWEGMGLPVLARCVF